MIPRISHLRSRHLISISILTSTLVRAAATATATAAAPSSHPLARQPPPVSVSVPSSSAMSTLASIHAADAFTSHGVIEDLTHAAPRQLLKVKFGSQEVNPGAIRLVADTQHEPSIEWPAEHKEEEADKQLYTVIMADPDGEKGTEITGRQERK